MSNQNANIFSGNKDRSAYQQRKDPAAMNAPGSTKVIKTGIQLNAGMAQANSAGCRSSAQEMSE